MLDTLLIASTLLMDGRSTGMESVPFRVSIQDTTTRTVTIRAPEAVSGVETRKQIAVKVASIWDVR